jgi:chromosome partitioning protein
MSTRERPEGPHVIVLGNEKGGTGKSTTAVHIALALASAGLAVRLVDADHRQQTSARYLANRARWAEAQGLSLITPPSDVLEDGEEARLEALLAAPDLAALVVDTPGRDSVLGRRAIAGADTLITPINDSFVDFDLLGQVDGTDYRVTRPSFYAELVWKARQARARQGATVDWVVLRNRLSPLEARNRKRVGAALEELAKRVGFRVVPGLAERVIYRELFPRGLTLLDLDQLKDASMGHVAARAELRELIAALELPLADAPRAVRAA